jgi:GWxTD domain-containing protein
MTDRGPARTRTAAARLGAVVLGCAASLGALDTDLLNLSLGPELATWLIGPMARLATPAEEREFLAITDDAAAQAFIERFWAARDPDPERPGNPVRETAEARALEADRRFAEVDAPGRRTDRGTLFVVHGEPATIEFEPGDFKGDPPLEVWRYDADAAAGLDGKRPERRYRFVEQRGRTVVYLPGQRRPRRPGLDPTGPGTAPG